MTDNNDEPATITPASGPDRDEMAANYLPEGQDWPAKTQLDLNDPHAVAALSQLDKMFPEISGDDELQGMIDQFKHEFLKSRTSVGGRSREEYLQILKAMFGGSPDDDNGMGDLAEMLGADDDD